MVRIALRILVGLVIVVLIAAGAWRYFRPRPIASATAEQPVTAARVFPAEALRAE